MRGRRVATAAVRMSASKEGKPRSHSGGRSPRHALRHAARGHARTFAPSWTDATAFAVLGALHDGSVVAGVGITQHTLGVLGSSRARVSFLGSLRLCADDRAVAAAILMEHSSRLQAVQGVAEKKAAVRRFLKPLRERKSTRAKAEALVLNPCPRPPQRWQHWLAADPAAERLRDLRLSQRPYNGVQAWPLGWMRGPGVVCYERADGRVRNERGGVLTADFVRRLVWQEELPTAVASSSDHYIVVRPDGPPRFMTVEEVCRAFGLPRCGPTWEALLDPAVMTANQAVSCLGRAVQADVARAIVAQLVAEGALRSGCKYGSSFSGVDTFAAAVEAELGGDWSYVFAGECFPPARRALLHAWGRRGLVEETCVEDACSERAAEMPPVDLYVTTPNCEKHSRRNHDKTPEGRSHSLEEVWASLEYVRAQRPGVVVVENVHEVSSVGPITGLLARLEGYRLRAGALDPRTTAGIPMARDRYFWVLTRKTVRMVYTGMRTAAVSGLEAQDARGADQDATLGTTSGSEDFE